jgi:DNA-binding response OmpR family regulator
MLRIAAAELGERDQPFLDERDRSVDLGDARIQLSPLEFGVLKTLAAHPAALRRAPTSFGGQLGIVADRIETVRGVGYRLR